MKYLRWLFRIVVSLHLILVLSACYSAQLANTSKELQGARTSNSSSEQKISSKLVALTVFVLSQSSTGKSLTEILKNELQLPLNRIPASQKNTNHGLVQFAGLSFNLERHDFERIPTDIPFVPLHHRFIFQTHLKLSSRSCINIEDLPDVNPKVSYKKIEFKDSPSLISYWIQADANQLLIVDIRTEANCLHSIRFEQITSNFKE